MLLKIYSKPRIETSTNTGKEIGAEENMASSSKKNSPRKKMRKKETRKLLVCSYYIIFNWDIYLSIWYWILLIYDISLRIYLFAAYESLVNIIIDWCVVVMSLAFLLNGMISMIGMFCDWFASCNSAIIVCLSFMKFIAFMSTPCMMISYLNTHSSRPSIISFQFIFCNFFFFFIIL